jgi:Protein of unknown function (DUF3014)
MIGYGGLACDMPPTARQGAAMDDFDDLRLDRTGVELPPPRVHRAAAPIIAVAVLIAAAAFWYFMLRRPVPADVTVRTDVARVETPKPPPRPVAEPGDNIPLPPLEESDAVVRELVAHLSAHPRVAAWLTTDQLVRNFTVVVVNVANGQAPSKHLAAVRPTGKFQVLENGGRIAIDPRSYARYDGHAKALESMDARGAARLFATLKPRIEDAYKELGSPDGTIDKTLERALVELLETPVIDENVALKSDTVSYKYASPSLESLSKVQRQFLRMGPRNVSIVKAKLREIARYLGIPEESLPPERGTEL